jgi:hypothetical protein
VFIWGESKSENAASLGKFEIQKKQLRTERHLTAWGVKASTTRLQLHLPGYRCRHHAPRVAALAAAALLDVAATALQAHLDPSSMRNFSGSRPAVASDSLSKKKVKTFT